MEYPFIKCLHPVQVNTLKGITLVRCGKCPACESSIKSELQLRIQCEAKKHKHSYFVTLTYDDVHLPLFTPVVALESEMDDCDKVSPYWYDSEGFAHCVKDFPPLMADGDFINVTEPFTDCGMWLCNQSRVYRDGFSPFNDSHDFDGRFGHGFFDEVFGSYVFDKGTILGQLYEYHRYLAKAKQTAINANYAAKVTSWYSQVDTPFMYVPMLYYRDAQNFLKRLRKQLSKIDKDEKIRYYIIGEYGTKSLRPHWHLLLFTNSDKISRAFNDSRVEVELLRRSDRAFYTNRILSSCWRFGYSTIDKADSKVGGYVASYVVGSSLLPSVLQKIAPQKTFHSIGFGLPYSKNQSLEMLKHRDYQRFTEFQYVDEAAGCCVKSRPLWRSYYSQFFPTFTGFNSLSDDEIYRVLTVVPQFKGYFFEQTLSVIAKKIWCILYRSQHGDFHKFDSTQKSICKFFDWLHNPPLSAIERILYASNKFLQISSYFGMSPRSFFDIYLDFIRWRDKKCLAQHFANCAKDANYMLDYYKIYGVQLNSKEKLFDRYKNSLYFSYFKRDVEMLSYTRIKHKEIFEQIKNI